jgi:hypothetical protein
MKQFASWFTHGVTGGSKLRQQIFTAKTGKAVLESVDAFFEARLSENLVEASEHEPELVDAFSEEALTCGD